MQKPISTYVGAGSEPLFAVMAKPWKGGGYRLVIRRRRPDGGWQRGRIIGDPVIRKVNGAEGVRATMAHIVSAVARDLAREARTETRATA